MSLVNRNISEIPSETVRVAKASFPKGTSLLVIRDQVGPLFQDEEFSDLYSWKGAEGISPALLATVTVLQYAEGLSDRQAVEAVCGRIDWKYLFGVPLEYAGFDQSVLSDFRSRLIDAGKSERLFEGPLAQLKAMGAVKGKGRQRSDSTHVLASVKTLNRLELVGETMRQAVNQLVITTPDWLVNWMPAAWYERYDARMEQAKFPTGKKARKELAQQIGQDGFRLLEAVAQPDSPRCLQTLPAIEILRTVWAQQFVQTDDNDSDSNRRVEYRTAETMPPGAEIIDTPYDPEARFSRKRKTTWTGYKVHFTESCDDERPHLITHVETTAATEPDCLTLPTIHKALDEKDLLPAEHLVDGGYVDVDNVLDSRSQVEVVGPMRPDTSWQASGKTGYDIAHFIVDWTAESVTCPQGKLSQLWSHATDKDGAGSITIRFRKDDCIDCPARERCTRSKDGPRGLRLQPREKHEFLQSARKEQLSDTFYERYRKRAGVEGTISQGVRALGLRRSRYIGTAKTRLQHLATASAMNLSRLARWLMGFSRSETRVSPVAELLTLCNC